MGRRPKEDNIKVIVEYPDDPEMVEEIERRKAKWILDRQIEKYGEEAISVAYPIWIRTKELEEEGYEYEEAKKIAIEEYGY